MAKYDDLQLVPKDVGALPLIRRFLERLRLDELLATYVPEKKLGRHLRVTHARALATMVANVLVSRRPLYAVPRWIERHVPEHLGLTRDRARAMNDDRIGRALHRLYEVDPASLMTALVVRAVKEFDLDLSQIHSDTTSVTFCGDYAVQKGKEVQSRPPLITFGHNKDHRPDLKQLVYLLAISADGAVPVHYKTYDGNTTDDKTHIDTWSAIRKLAGRPDFVYVADSKLCTRENMAFIAGHGGVFLTVMPRSRHEDDAFRTYVQEHFIPWDEVRREKGPSGHDKPDVVYEAFEPDQRTNEGYRLIWYRSSVKTAMDEKRRSKRMDRARMRIENLQERTGAHRFRSVEAAQKAADAVVQEEGAQRWLAVRVTEHRISDFKQATPGRAGKNTSYRRIEIPVIRFLVEDIAEAIQADAKCDGLFAMVTNDEQRSPRELLDVYKYQPFLEKRNEQLKSVLAVAPVFLKRPERVSALLFVYFIAVLVFALIERETRRAMRAAGIESLPLYPEERLCKAPTTDGILRAFEGLRRSQLVDAQGNVVRTFHDQPSPIARQLIKLLRIDPKPYGL